MTQDTKIDWGAEIPVNGKRPEWLAPEQEIMICDGSDGGFSGNGWYGGFEGNIPFYGRDITEDEVAIRLPADHPHYAKPTLPDDLTARMVALVKSVAQYVPEAFSEVREARAIVALLEPVDDDRAAAVDLIDTFGDAMPDAVSLATAAIKRGRALERGEGND